MIVHIDTSALIDALTGPRRSLPALRRLVERGDRLAISSIVLYEWRRGPRTDGELAAQENLLPAEHAAVFGPTEAALAASIYRKISKPRGREIDVAIAACALSHNGGLWTLNRGDFDDIPGLRLVG